MSTKRRPPEPATRPNLWVEPARPTFAGLAQLLARAEACGFLPETLWLVSQSERGKTFLIFLEAFEEIGLTWSDVALGLEQAAHLLDAKDENEREALLRVGLPLAQLAAALRVRQALSSGWEHQKAGELVQRLSLAAQSETMHRAAMAAERI